MALGCTWNGYAATGIALSEFYDNNFTVAIRFLRRYPNAYTGPMIVNEETSSPGTFVLAQGTFDSDAAKTQIALKFPLLAGKVNGMGNLLIILGTETRTLLLPSDGGWHHLALVCKNGSFQAFVDGSPEGDAIPKPSTAPDGKLWLGRSSKDLRGGKGTQFYGLLDDFAIFSTALSNSAVKDLASARHLTGNEADLFAGHTFGFVPAGGLSAKLSRPLESVSAAAAIVETTPTRNALGDLALVPLPLNSHMRLPFPRGEEWRVVQGFDDPGGSHRGYASFCWDFVKDSGGSEGEQFISCAPGTISGIRESQPSGTNTVNFVTVQQAPVEFCDYVHLVKSTVPVKVGDKVGFGAALGQVGDTGTKGPHLHLGVTTTGEGDKDAGDLGFFTIPVAFSNYDVKNPDGDWKRVIRGTPRKNQIVRTPAEDGPILFGAVWAPATHKEIQVYNWKFEDFKQKYDAIKEDGWRLHMLRVVTFDNIPRYTAVWRKTGVDEKRAYSYKQQDLKEKHADLASKGWNMRILTAFQEDGGLRYSAVWTQGTAEQELVLSLPRAAYDQKAKQLNGEGARLDSLAAFHIMNVDAYSAVWTKNANADQRLAHGQTRSAFRDTYDDLWPDGWRLVRLAICNPHDSPPLYSGCWRKSPGAKETQVYDWNYEDVRARYDVLWELGWRLKCIEPYRR